MPWLWTYCFTLCVHIFEVKVNVGRINAKIIDFCHILGIGFSVLDGFLV